MCPWGDQETDESDQETNEIAIGSALYKQIKKGSLVIKSLLDRVNLEQNVPIVDQNQNQMIQLMQEQIKLMHNRDERQSSEETGSNNTVKLPELTIEPFSGNMLYW